MDDASFSSDSGALKKMNHNGFVVLTSKTLASTDKKPSLLRSVAGIPSKKKANKSARRSDNVDGGPPAKKPARVENRQYKKAWEEIPELRGWITPCPGHPERACCLYCGISLRAHRRDLVDHSMTERHIRNAHEAAAAIGVDNEDIGEVKEKPTDFLSDNLYEYRSDQISQLNEEQLNDASCSGMEVLRDGPILESKPTMAALTRAVRNSQQQILVVQTGGTIDKDYPRNIRGYAFEIGEAASQRIFERLGVELPVVSRTVCRKDSQEISAEDRFLIYDCCVNAPQQRILITHGTDTMLETAAYLSDYADLATKIIVITGALKPETFKNSDADFNIGCALGALQTLSSPGVYVSMHGIVARWDLLERDVASGKFVKKVTPIFM